jgi:hypothetical protein
VWKTFPREMRVESGEDGDEEEEEEGWVRGE